MGQIWVGLGRSRLGSLNMCQTRRRPRGMSGLLLGLVHESWSMLDGAVQVRGPQARSRWTASTSPSPLSDSWCTRCMWV